MCSLRWFALIVLLLTTWRGAKSVLPQGSHFDGTYEELLKFNNRIEQQRRQLAQKGNGSSIAWGQLGILYWERNVIWKQGGLTEALECFTTARDIAAQGRSERDRFETFAWSLQKANVHGQLGEMANALETLSSALEYAKSDSDKATVLYGQAEVMLMLAYDPRAALGLYNASLRLAPCGAEAGQCRRKMVRARAEVNKTSLSGWKKVVADLERDLAINLDVLCKEEIEYERMLDAKQPSAVERVPATTLLHWALFEAAEKANDLEKAWMHLEKAHELESSKAQRKMKVYNVDKSTAKAKHTMNFFKKGYWPPPELRIGHTSRMPVFIVGFTRSGTTLMETLLDAHPDIMGMGEESPFVLEMHSLEKDLLAISKRLEEEKKTAAKDDVSDGYDDDDDDGDDEDDASAAAKKNAQPGPYTQAVEFHAKHILKRMTEIAELQREREVSASIGLDGSGKALKRGRNKSPHAKMVVDKMLANYKNIGLIHLLFPNATILHMVRDPMDTLLSNYRNRFEDDSMIFAIDAKVLTYEYTLYLEIMAHFRRELPNRIIDVSYEWLVSNPEEIMRPLIEDHFGLPWSPRVLAHHQENRTVNTLSVHQVRKPIYKSSIGGWRKFSKQLLTMAQSFVRHYSRLAEAKAFPSLNASTSFAGQQLEMNWQIDPEFDYEKNLEKDFFAFYLRRRKAFYASLKNSGGKGGDDQEAKEGLDINESFEELVKRRNLLRKQVEELDEKSRVSQTTLSPANELKKIVAITGQGRLLILMKRPEEAAAMLDEALKLMTPASIVEAQEGISAARLQKRAHTLITFFKAQALSSVKSRLAEAAALFRQILVEEPDDLDVYYHLVVCLKEGALLTKRKEWRALIEEIQTAMDERDEKQRMRKKNNNNKKSQNDAVIGQGGEKWALYLASEMAREPVATTFKYLEAARSFDARAANASSSVYKYSKLDARKKVNLIKKIYKEGYWPVPLIGSLSRTPVFIVGFPRSGTTLLESMLHSHKDIFAMGEDSIFYRSIDAFHSDLMATNRANEERGFEDFSPQQEAALRATVKKHTDRIMYYMNTRAATEGNNKSFFLTNDTLPAYVIDKTLINYQEIGLIHLLFPHATILNLVRDPMDILFSNFKNRFLDPHLSYTLDINSLTNEYAMYLEVMAHYHKELPNRIVDVSYEWLVSNPEELLHPLIEKLLDLPWDERVLSHQLFASSKTASALQVQHPTHTASIGSWTRYSKQLKPLVKALAIQIKRLSELDALPSPPGVKINWALSPNFDYDDLIASFHR